IVYTFDLKQHLTHLLFELRNEKSGIEDNFAYRYQFDHPLFPPDFLEIVQNAFFSLTAVSMLCYFRKIHILVRLVDQQRFELNTHVQFFHQIGISRALEYPLANYSLT